MEPQIRHEKTVYYDDVVTFFEKSKNGMKKKGFVLVFVFSLSLALGSQNAYAYIDPGSGSIIIQALIGTLVGVGITLKIYWYKIREKFLSKKSKE